LRFFFSASFYCNFSFTNPLTFIFNSHLHPHQNTQAKALLAGIYGPEKATKAFVDWRLFFLTLVECFDIDDGNQWAVNLYRFVKPPAVGGAGSA
jgi:hypothetical protein